MEIKVVRQIMEWNENCHDEIQKYLDDKKVFLINVMGSPGAGKTTFIKAIINNLRDKYNIGVIEGDIASKIDAEKIAEIGIPVVELNTDGACHIEAMSIKNILPNFDLDNLDILIVENIGNLVCPAEFDIGEHLKIAILSVPEGDDKVPKYPLMFTRSNALIINKFDLKDIFNFDDKKVENEVKTINKNSSIFKVNSVNQNGIREVAEWIEDKVKK
ncbi:hydrogenase nickel incorporation protein HypB [Haloimpatiens sp. FM7330]|uniref:hydrogenase nickel incorporation protein HypB n=1 Tax=Haloimpatiens sp. FM7330 TaxID=3298610 RepID=UPI0036262876